MPRTLARLAATALATVALTAGIGIAGSATASAAPADCSYKGYMSGPDQLGLTFDAVEQRMADMINAYRAQNGLPKLKVSTALARPTMWVSVDSALRGVSPSNHIDTRGMGIARRAEFCSGYRGAIGEINYWGHGGNAPTAEAAFAWWKSSPGHNALMLSRDYSHFSVGRAYIGVNAERQHWTVMFGTS
jgi:uncharacterized protein YkwD